MSKFAQALFFLLLAVGSASSGSASIGCASGGSASGSKREPTVPDETQRRSEERYGQQSQMMGSLNQTPAEQAAARHESSTRPPEDEPEPARESRE